MKLEEEPMMMKKLDKEKEYKIDLSSVEGDGSFPCPKCGTSISPDDSSEETYQILDTQVVNDELSELVISCGKCGSTIKLTGFLQVTGT
ncbi:MAG: hypothetical protein NWE92_08345 [Candidatus Bathyarchaeota archaeon]|nr:hypothetical protein [Candidatus Bathyarchaeota archaeon]